MSHSGGVDDACREGPQAAQDAPKITAGWHELVALPDLGLDRVFAKLDTGADRSSVHARHVRMSSDESTVEFAGPLLRVQRDCLAFDGGGMRQLRADVVDVRVVRSSNGEEQRRPVICTPLCIGALRIEARFSLANRAGLRFCVLLGRDLLEGRFVVDSSIAHRLDLPHE